MSRNQTDDVFSSSPAHPSHTRNPYANAQSQLRKSLKRSAAVATLPSPPQSTMKRQAQQNGVRTSMELRSSSSKHDTVPALLHVIQEIAERSPSPFSGPPVKEELPASRGSASKNEVAGESEESTNRPQTPPPRDTPPPMPVEAPVTPPPTRKRAKKTGPIRDSPNNPFLSTSPRHPRTSTLPPLEERETVDFVFRGAKSSFPNPFKKRPLAPGEVDPSTLDPADPGFSPDTVIQPKLLWPSSPSTPRTRSQTVAARMRSSRCDPSSIPSSPSEGPSSHPSATDTVPSELPVSRRLFPEAHAIGPSHHAKTAEMKEGIRKGRMSGSMVIAQAHGPIRAGKETLATVARPGLSREPSHIPKSTRVKAAESLLSRKASSTSASATSGVKTRSASSPKKTTDEVARRE
ncbi:uncharacterized protein EI90DRAFT_3128437 [Cantharellus anzutake]|uniref:uncharacterized protein n=1 Tax=Cantharellus anzutake TaxID=1750568 RepID=UPI0019040E0A|nr:uncharacterized protein EI90DRAFT_3128437 [Cantharellus anzutake]KAF8325899.1 hypothetical protein EI90DRAFT_3128437 [Cantharellus anzutake]